MNLRATSKRSVMGNGPLADNILLTVASPNLVKPFIWKYGQDQYLF